MRKIIFASIFFLGSTVAFAQSALDALRYSYIWHGGNARYMSMGGAFGALGANTSVFSTNPAGIGLFNNPEFNISSSILNSKSESVYNGDKGTDSRFNTTLSNIGIVLTKDYLNIETYGKWKNVQFGFGFNQLKNFNRSIHITGNNTSNSIADMYAELANGASVQEIEDDTYGEYTYDLNPAWWSYLFNNIENTNQYYGNTPPGGVFQNKFIESWGSMNEVSLTFGANYDNKLYLGATIGIPYYNYQERSIYTENALQTVIPSSSFRSLDIEDRLDSKGTGFNFKFGAIYRANDWLRFGLAIHTPTYFAQIQDEWDISIGSTWDSYSDTTAYSPVGFYEYNLTSPFKTLASIAFVIKNYGLISADFEVIDYSTAKLQAPDYNFASENDDVRMTYTAAGNIKLGTEWRVKNFSFRGGFSYYGSPYKNNINDASATSYSLGIGYKERNFYFDVAWVTTNQSEDYYLYGYNNVYANKAVNSLNNSNFLITYGYRF
ncbi:MAG: hypothetical protein CVU00_15465 [Bacteroidetes bacterium HGW-Bacteroidetes-17]|jgi:hypothetical protein|nr:MAG: hypothetical protein CVU00_15465 [Bacteroidetes bacterium HGW-Bacteroidetes-17]